MTDMREILDLLTQSRNDEWQEDNITSIGFCIERVALGPKTFLFAQYTAARPSRTYRLVRELDRNEKFLTLLGDALATKTGRSVTDTLVSGEQVAMWNPDKSRTEIMVTLKRVLMER
jgi:hypothetical protein